MPDLPHYKQVRAFHHSRRAFSIDNGLLTANGKLKRDLIAARLQTEIEEMYGGQTGGDSECIRRNVDMNHQGQALSWELQDGVIELALHREPCNEIGSLTLEIWRNLPPLWMLWKHEAHALIIYSPLKAGFCAGADLRELYQRSQDMDKQAATAACANFWSAFTK